MKELGATCDKVTRRANHQNLSTPPRKNKSLAPSGKSNLELPPSCPTRGALAIVANEGQGAVDAAARETNGLQRTVKSFGSDAPMQALTRDEAKASHGDGVTKSRVT